MTDTRPVLHAEPTVRVLYTAQQIRARVRGMRLEIAPRLPGL